MLTLTINEREVLEKAVQDKILICCELLQNHEHSKYAIYNSLKSEYQDDDTYYLKFNGVRIMQVIYTDNDAVKINLLINSL